MQTPIPDKLYTPERMGRRGEGIAWAMALITGLTWLILGSIGRPIPQGIAFLAIFFLLSALGISLATWMERRTFIRLHEKGIDFSNGLRNVQMPFEQLRRIEVFQGTPGKKVRVIGEQAHFEFRTLGEVKFQGKSQGQTGFKEGEDILRTLVGAGHLKKHPDANPGQSIYTRE